MSSEVEAAGAAVTAALAAGAIDRHGEGGAAHGTCVNCGTELSGNYCQTCGQPAHIHRTLGHMVEEFLHGILHFDTRAWRTLPYLLFRPGTLTHNYIHGMRARYISPLAIFLLAVFTMFFVFSLTGGVNIGGGDPAIRMAGITAQMTTTASRLANLEIELERLDAQPLPDDPEARQMLVAARAELQDQIAEARADIRDLEQDMETAQEGMTPGDGSVSGPAAIIVEAQPAPTTADGAAPAATGEAPGSRDFRANTFEEIREGARNGSINVNTGFKTLDKKIQNKLENPEFAVYKIQNTAYKFAFLLVPISLPFMWLLFFWKRGVTLFDHTVFILYSLSFTSLLFIAMGLAAFYPPLFIALNQPLIYALPVHMFFHLKGAYQLGWFSAVWRTSVLLVFCIIALLIFLLAIIALGFVG